MRIAIDETGDFSPKSNKYHFFSAVHLLSTGNNLDLIKNKLFEWEKLLPRSLKNHKGEIKGSSLSNDQLDKFIDLVLLSKPKIPISVVTIIPKLNHYAIINKHKQIQLKGILEGIELFKKLGRPEIAKTVNDFFYWFRKLSYSNFIKIELLGLIIYKSLRVSIGTLISSKKEDELLNLSFIIDEIFLKGFQQNTFWHELLRNQIYSESMKEPLPFLIDWGPDHPFISKYRNKDGIMDFNDLFWNNCSFEKSHLNYEIRIADYVNSILSKVFNENIRFERNQEFFNCIIPKKEIRSYIFKNFDLEEELKRNVYNPWENIEEFNSRMLKLWERTQKNE